MNPLVGTPPQNLSTSAGGAMRAPVGSLFIAVLLAGVGTSSAQAASQGEILRSPELEVRTTAGASVLTKERAGLAIGELRRLSGLTWDELARLFGVSRRSLHFWASGKAMTSANEEHLQRALGVLIRTDRGTSRANRTALFSVDANGVLPYDLLASGQYEAAVEVIGERRATQRVVPPPLSAEAKAAREPRPPGDRVSESRDIVHREAGRSRIAKSVRARGGP